MGALLRGWLRFPLCLWRLAARGAACGACGSCGCSWAVTWLFLGQLGQELCMVRPPPAMEHILCQSQFSLSCTLSAEDFLDRLGKTILWLHPCLNGRNPATFMYWFLSVSVIRQCLIVVGTYEDQPFESEVEDREVCSWVPLTKMPGFHPPMFTPCDQHCAWLL